MPSTRQPKPVPFNLGEFEQLVLLTLLRLGPDAYGASIQAEIEQRGRRETSVSAVYTTLERLEVKGLVRSRVGEPTPQRGGKRKKHYQMTALGTRALQQSFNLMKRMVEGVESLLKETS